MLEEIQSIINKFANGSAVKNLPKGKGAPFEMWLLLRIAEKLFHQPYSAELRDSFNKPINQNSTFRLRGAPGRIGVGNACHVSFLWNNIRYEIHANAEFIGRSSVEHEIDISFIPETLAEYIRSSAPNLNPTGVPMISIECKFKRATGSKDEARQVVARQYDLHFLSGHPSNGLSRCYTMWVNQFPIPGSGNRKNTYYESFSNCFNALCRFGGVTAKAGEYLNFNKVNVYNNMKPNTNEVDNFLNDLVSFINHQNP